tara:strand:+ start:6584 stop:7423 length:840 start_codon:yes stop_codon:yes gene_type:complete
MKQRIRHALAALTISASLAAIPVQAAPAPEVTYDMVQEIFGLNLETEDTALKTLLLAVGMDHTSPDSPFAELRIGIPFIVHDGPNYWVSRLKSGERKVDVLVNNALLLLFTKEEIPRKEEVARKLMELAGGAGYWPADFYIANDNIEKRLSRDYSTPNFVSLPMKDNVELQALAQDTMNRLNRCAGIGFAPCQYRIGFWLVSSPETRSDGVKVLQQAVATSIADKRYKGFLEAPAIMAAEQILLHGKAAGLDDEQITNITEFVSVMREEIAEAAQEPLQ